MKNTFYAWAINTNYVDFDGSKKPDFFGRHYWFWKSFEHMPDKFEGCQVVLFNTRAIARKNLQWVKSSYKKASVVKVKVTVEEKK